MAQADSDRRWQELNALHDEVAAPVVLPIRRSRDDGSPREASRGAIRLAEALAFDDSWSRISEARRRPPRAA